MSGGDVIVTITLNAALHVTYTAGDLATAGVNPVSRPGYRAGGRGVTVARVLRAFGHDVLAAGLVGGGTGELIREDLARSGVPTAFTLIRGESRRFLRFASPDPAGPVLRFAGSWPDRLRHALALAAGGAGAWTRAPGGPEDRDHVDLAAYERLLDAVRVEQSATRTVPDRDDVITS